MQAAYHFSMEGKSVKPVTYKAGYITFNTVQSATFVVLQQFCYIVK